MIFTNTLNIIDPLSSEMSFNNVKKKYVVPTALFVYFAQKFFSFRIGNYK